MSVTPPPEQTDSFATATSEDALTDPLTTTSGNHQPGPSAATVVVKHSDDDDEEGDMEVQALSTGGTSNKPVKRNSTSQVRWGDGRTAEQDEQFAFEHSVEYLRDAQKRHDDLRDEVARYFRYWILSLSPFMFTYASSTTVFVFYCNQNGEDSEAVISTVLFIYYVLQGFSDFVLLWKTNSSVMKRNQAKISESKYGLSEKVFMMQFTLFGIGMTIQSSSVNFPMLVIGLMLSAIGLCTPQMFKAFMIRMMPQRNAMLLSNMQGIMGLVSFLLGNFMGGAISDLITVRTVFIVGTVTCIISVILTYLFLFGKQVELANRMREFHPIYTKLQTDVKLRKIVAQILADGTFDLNMHIEGYQFPLARRAAGLLSAEERSLHTRISMSRSKMSMDNRDYVPPDEDEYYAGNSGNQSGSSDESGGGLSVDMGNGVVITQSSVGVIGNGHSTSTSTTGKVSKKYGGEGAKSLLADADAVDETNTGLIFDDDDDDVVNVNDGKMATDTRTMQRVNEGNNMADEAETVLDALDTPVYTILFSWEYLPTFLALCYVAMALSNETMFIVWFGPFMVHRFDSSLTYSNSLIAIFVLMAAINVGITTKITIPYVTNVSDMHSANQQRQRARSNSNRSRGSTDSADHSLLEDTSADAVAEGLSWLFAFGMGFGMLAFGTWWMFVAPEYNSRVYFWPTVILGGCPFGFTLAMCEAEIVRGNVSGFEGKLGAVKILMVNIVRAIGSSIIGFFWALKTPSLLTGSHGSDHLWFFFITGFTFVCLGVLPLTYYFIIRPIRASQMVSHNTELEMSQYQPM